MLKNLSGFDIVSETYKKDVKDNTRDRIQIEIGDSKQPDFKPQFKIMRWDNEVNFSMRAQEVPGATMETDKGVVKYITPDYEVHQYEKPDVAEDGGFEFEWVLKSPPSSNVVTATIQSKELDFFYQPALTELEIELGLRRPENIIGSYAVFHKTKQNSEVSGKDYRTGKAFHIYRPRVTDAKNQQAWCELNIDTEAGILTVTIPFGFLQTATYPVVVDPTFGYTTAGASSINMADNIAGSIFTLSEAGTVSKLSAFTQGDVFGSNFVGGIYDTSLNLVTNGATPVTFNGTDAMWRDFTYSSQPSLSAADYWLVANSQVGSFSSPYLYYDSGASNQNLEKAHTYSGTLPSSISSPSYFAFKCSIYATYTASGGGSPTVRTLAALGVG